MHFSIGIFMLFCERLSYFSCLGPVIIIFLIFRTSGFFLKNGRLLHAGPHCRSWNKQWPRNRWQRKPHHPGQARSRVWGFERLCQRWGEPKGCSFGLFLSPYWSPATWKAVLTTRDSPYLALGYGFLSCPKDYGSYGFSRLNCSRCAQIIWVLNLSRASSRLKTIHVKMRYVS